MATHEYQCPFCKQIQGVPTERVMQPIACVGCGRPFIATAPHGQLMQQDAESQGYVPASMSSQTEETIARVTPAAYRQRPLLTFGLAILAIASAILMFWAMAEMPGGFPKMATIIVGLVFCVGSLLPLIWWAIQVQFETLDVTTQRTIWKRGILDKRVSEVQHDDIRNIQTNQFFIDRIFKIGTVAVSSAGQSDMEITVKGVPNPDNVVALIRKHQQRLVKGD